MVKVTVDGQAVEVAPGTTIMQACEEAGAEIPRFCYHERLSVAGNCRMCLVEVENAPKPVASCAMPVAPDMVVSTTSETVKTAREGVMEFLLINHPLDCPICDQGGECDLQDQALGFGGDASRFDDNKRAVENKNMGPLVKTIMTRCIHCTRCVRFAQEVAGVPEIGAIGRGEDTEITTYLEASLDSEMSGNVIDLCPVGALTSRPYAFTARPWELRKTETIDVMDALGSNIRVDMRGREAMRIMPRNHDDVNEEWLSDKSRFVWDGLNTQRLDRPFIRENGKLTPASWDAAFDLVESKLKGKGAATAAIAGDLVCAEGQFALKDLMDALASPHVDCRQDGAKISGPRGNYIFNASIAGIEEADALLLIGSNPRLEAPVLNARIRKRYLMGDFPIAAIGEAVDLTYKAQFIGAGADTLADLLAGKQSFADTLKNAKNPMILIGQGALTRDDGAAVLAAAIELAAKTGASFNMLHTAAARVAGLDLGLLPGEGGHDVAGIQDAAQSGAIENVILYGADEIAGASLGDAFVVYIGSHGDRGAHRADVILPAAAYTEKQATYVNTEGRAQMTEQAATPPGEAREDWKIFRALSARLDATLPYDNLAALRAAMYEAVPHLAQLDDVIAADAPVAQPHDGLGAEAFTYAVSDFYFTNPIARASAIMADCAKAKNEPKNNGDRSEGTGTDG
ncbi:MAG: NADH-quinone oxidoreductase subunit G [PS1 clade bacterium]|nr:NADH-quinone oxidoreductase subunit G [PS1 clade bacterium]MBL6783876.1 NADH-quinone oxidoreductase subunit G [PS1 clade bacterium]